VKKLVGCNLWILKSIQRICHTGPKRPWVWDPMLGLIIDVRAPRATFPAATLSRVWVVRFVYLVFPIRLYNDHKYSSPPSTKTSRDEQLLLGAWRNSGELTYLDYLPTKQKMWNISRTWTHESPIYWGPLNDTRIHFKRALNHWEWWKTQKERVHPSPETQHVKYLQNAMVDASNLFRP